MHSKFLFNDDEPSRITPSTRNLRVKQINKERTEDVSVRRRRRRMSSEKLRKRGETAIFYEYRMRRRKQIDFSIFFEVCVLFSVDLFFSLSFALNIPPPCQEKKEKEYHFTRNLLSTSIFYKSLPTYSSGCSFLFKITQTICLSFMIPLSSA